MKLYYIPQSPPCRAVLLIIKALNLKVDLHELDMHKRAEHKLPWYRIINPTHTVPSIDDDGFTLWESRAIMTYLVRKYGKDDSLYPEDFQKRALIDKMLYFDMGNLGRGIGDYLIQVYTGKEVDSDKANALKQCLEYLDSFLIATKFVAGDNLTIADFSILATVSALDRFGYDYKSYVNIIRWTNDLKILLPYFKDIIPDGAVKQS